MHAKNGVPFLLPTTLETFSNKLKGEKQSSYLGGVSIYLNVVADPQMDSAKEQTNRTMVRLFCRAAFTVARRKI